MIVRVQTFPSGGGPALQDRYELLPNVTSLQQAAFVLQPIEGPTILEDTKTRQSTLVYPKKATRSSLPEHPEVSAGKPLEASAAQAFFHKKRTAL